ncbi:MAG TPA: quercetin 2,3-dioxygenase, partial [Rhodocyclaceae bacterium]|nr:quercetin 2,3-dioxygenase [Rhodocyclaceae bacterium]
GSLTIHQDARLYAGLLAPGEKLNHGLAPGRRAYLHLVSGQLTVNGERLAGGDGAKIADETALALAADTESELLLFDLP